MSTETSRAEAPFGAPDVLWEKYNGKVPEGAIVCGTLNDEPVYIGRVYIENEIIIGSANLKKGVCTYYHNDAVSESSDFEVMHVPVGEPLEWEKCDENSSISLRIILKAGRQKTGHMFYVGRVQDGNNTFIGSVDFDKKQAYIAVNGTGKVFNEFEILIHKHLEFLCICPPCPSACRLESE